MIDLDALNAAEKENWVWHGADCLAPDYTRCLVALSRGGADADVTREFDLGTKSWVPNGFVRPEAKGGVSWIDHRLLRRRALPARARRPAAPGGRAITSCSTCWTT